MCTVHYSSFLVGLFKVMIRITGTRVMQSACRCRQWCSISSTPGQVNLLIGGQCAFRESLRCLWTLPKYSAQSEIVTDAPNSRTEREMYRVRPKTNKQRRLMAWNLQGKNNHYESSAKQRFFQKIVQGFLTLYILCYRTTPSTEAVLGWQNTSSKQLTSKYGRQWLFAVKCHITVV